MGYGGQGEYDGHCRRFPPAPVAPACIRFRAPDPLPSGISGRREERAGESAVQSGRNDVVLKDRNGNFSYQFCVVHDDLEQSVNLIVRGADLKHTVEGQRSLRKVLSQEKSPEPLYWHHALLMDQSGLKKLSKSNQAEPVRAFRDRGFTPGHVLGLAAYQAGLLRRAGPVTLDDLVEIIADELPESFLAGISRAPR